MEHTEIERFNLFIRRKYNFLIKKNIFIVLPIVLNFYNDLSTQGSSQADTDFKSWRKENQTPLNNYNHDKVSPYSHLDYEGLISNFDSPKYNSDFEYQMAQAEECYKRKLFLPAAATLSVALETLLMAICDKEKVKLNSKDSSDTMMNYLGQRLLSEGKINYRMHKRIDITYSLRNSVSHSNPGEVSKADCQIILSCIKVLIDEHYSK
ncbi:phage protein [Staphylococcus aureus]|nr:phage protein [Staphylococcus aureus]